MLKRKQHKVTNCDTFFLKILKILIGELRMFVRYIFLALIWFSQMILSAILIFVCTIRATPLERSHQFSNKFIFHWTIQPYDFYFKGSIDCIDCVNKWFAIGISENGGMKGADIWAFIPKNSCYEVKNSFWSFQWKPFLICSKIWIEVSF